MRAQGNTAGPSLAGLIFPASGRLDWFVAVKFINSGYIKDDEAKEWNADELLKNLREGTEEANKDRIARGFEPIEVVGWAELPASIRTLTGWFGLRRTARRTTRMARSA